MRTCTIANCGRKHVAKGLCANHYNRATYTSAQRHPKRLVPCAACGTEVLRYPSGSRYQPTCSNECRYAITYGRRKPGTQLVGPITVEPRVHSTEPPITVITSGRGFRSIECQWCGDKFLMDLSVTGADVRYCSSQCSKRRAKATRRARECGASGTYTLAEVVRLWLGFNKCCAYCERPTDGLPDPDHVTPLSRGGSNSITNILPSCRSCNTDKNDMTLSEWANDRVRRGLAPVTTTWPPGDRRVIHLVTSAPTKPRWMDTLISPAA